MADEPEVVLQTRLFRVVRQEVPGREGHPLTRHWVLHPGAVTIVPMIDDERVCLIRNHRFAVGETLVELPAGTLVPGEDPRLAAERELAEETGYRAKELVKLCEFFMSPGVLQEKMHVYVARQLEAGPMALEDGEEIERCEVSWSEAMRMAESGQIRDAKTLAALLLYDRLRQRGG